MGGPTQLSQDWCSLTGEDVSHVSRGLRVLQVAKQIEVGKTGKAALLSGASFINFLFAKTTGDEISAGPERVRLWRSLERDRSQREVIVKATSETNKAFRAKFDSMRTAEELRNPHAKHDILPGYGNLCAGLEAAVEAMSDLGFNIPLQHGNVPFAQVVSYMQLKLELWIGGNEGPLAFVRTMDRQDRYSVPGWPITNLRPVVSVVTIEVPHLIVFARQLADSKARSIAAKPVPPSSPAPPAGSRNGNAEVVPTTSASTTEHPDTTSVTTDADSHQDGHNTSEGNPNLSNCANSSVEESASLSRSGEPFDAHFGSQSGSQRAA